MAAVLSCGPEAALSHESAAARWGIRDRENGLIEVSVPTSRNPRPRGITVHRCAVPQVTEGQGIPLTTPVATLVDLAARLPIDRLERAVNEADRLDLIDPEELRAALDRLSGRKGAGILKRTLDRRTFTLTDSELERRFLRLVNGAKLPLPDTGVRLNGVKVDFFWPQIGLVVETDGLRYHRTPAQQRRDRERDQAHTAAGLTTLRFTHAQVHSDPKLVQRTLLRVIRRLEAASAPRRSLRSPGA
jgi:very-short-patch-repair endonuclease